jgi:thiol-disulfide isomerase/thioredoxin
MNKSYLIPLIILIGVGSVLYHRYQIAHDIVLSGIIVNKNAEQAPLEKFIELPAVVHFYAAWCGPCMREMPEIIAFAEKNKEKFNVVFVTDDNNDVIANTTLRFNTNTERFFQTPSLKENNIYSIPVTYFINAKGEIAHSILGECDWQNPEFEKEVEQYLNQ